MSLFRNAPPEAPCGPLRWPLSRRNALARSALGFGWLAAAALLADEPKRAQPTGPEGTADASRLMLRPPHFGGTAQRVVLLFQHGGPSQLDLFDPKPALAEHAGRNVPGGVEAFFDKQDSGLCMPSPFRFSQHGQSGMTFSELLPQLAECADDLCQVRSMHTELNDHEGALRLFQTGMGRVGRPTLGAWVTYALGSDNQNLPGYVVLADPKGHQVDGIKNWSAGWLPSICQGTPLRSQGSPLFDLEWPARVQPQTRQAQMELLAALNKKHRQRLPHVSELEARIANFELAGNIREAVMESMDVFGESAATQALYGMGQTETGSYGTRCLMARRLLERGVRFVSVFNDLIMGDPWDTHFQHNDRIRTVAANVDRPSAALITDLKQRGLLDDTLVIWAGEFGRLPVAQGKDGRDHNRHGFTILLAGGGIRPGLTYGQTDDFGYKVQEHPVSVNDLQATILHLLGLDHERLTFRHAGRDESLTDAIVSGAQVVHELLVNTPS
ncbi:MAG: DUF1501 domain-containing protein [Planctomycetales bacterium]